MHIKNNFKSNAAYTRNQGAKCAKTEWVCFLDSDDSFAADKLIKLAHEIVENNHSNKTVFINQAVVNGYTFKQLDFVGTNIYWGTHERPISKGESVNYSLKWITENKGRVTECAYNNFMFKFVVMKCLRGGGKLHSLQYISKVKLNYISYKYKMYFLILFFTLVFYISICIILLRKGK
ncbi:glycosyltransferase [Escherichia coli]|uniref:glycosyltransferase n=1 Tax=Escherichia coli TaxID=562 RepID=UPI0023D7DDFA|nr:glycosyltransferase [Escherichia coli]MDF0687536.1 glycosyltransferase [Escherichia coli]